MTDKIPRKPVAGSRVPTSAPRRIAGRAARPTEAGPDTSAVEDLQVAAAADAAEADAAAAGAATDSGASTDAGSGASSDTGPDKAPDADTTSSNPATDDADDTAGRTAGDEPVGDPIVEPGDEQEPAAAKPGLLSRRRTTRVLTAVAALLTLAIVAGLATSWVASREDDAGSADVLAFDKPYKVSDEPVKVPVTDWNSANTAAEKAITEIFTFDWKDYDKNVEAAKGLITDRFAKEYSRTAKATREKFVASKADYDVTVVGRSVVEATKDEVATLIFLNQFVYKGEGKQRTGPEVYQARMLVRMVRTDNGWLVDELRTD